MPIHSATGLIGILAALLAVEGVRKIRRNANRPPLPPGPTPVPFIGNIIGMDVDAPYITYAEWAKMYGDLLYTYLLNQEIIVISSEKIAIELLDKRSVKYSDRPVVATADMFGFGWTTSLARYGPRLKLHRKIFHQTFLANTVASYRPKLLQKAYGMLLHVLQDQDNYAAHIETFTASVVMAVTYGYDASPGDPLVKTMKYATDTFLAVATPERAALFGAFPILKSLPSWFPFMSFKREAAECKKSIARAIEEPYEFVKRSIDEGTASQSMVSDAISNFLVGDDAKDPALVQVIKESSATVYGAAVETTNSTILVFLYLMALHPEVQARAQAEIDSVVGTERLPDFHDQPSLPYVEAIIRETMRWNPVTPVLPHATSEDDVYNGYYIPKGATVLMNLWAMSRNEEMYPNPSVFLPERFLNNDGTLTDDNVSWIFGFGRRICPGRYMGRASLWAAMVCILAFFRVERPKGSKEVKWTKGLTSHPLPFECSFIPRHKSVNAEKLASLISSSRLQDI
ncbi:hypothetical protein HYDPIDRAFT_112573 [Hydnomerulius pinastri MD-312]|uniref:Unplaced genomic scaffold scaffold_14, whole genome shotgun sequence n=1 Tax=Hydnomerulius pinastri MD-312 TaxID=994086 RepID=A0A0C9WFA3_9AGAM|nr:hypothetical protein HYDPIDRAFT_112573 [Hydnomerulius pinastri MD-312]